MKTDHEWPGEWEDLILKDNVVVVVGAGKSGLTNLCNLLASLSPVYYIYGNTILKAMPVGEPSWHPVVRSVFLYDYVVPYVRGIRGCELPCAIEDRLLWARTPEERLNKFKLALGSASTLEYAAKNRAYYVTDVLDGAVRWKEYGEVFPDCRVIHLVRNGFDVISARLSMNWDTPYGYRFPCGPTADWLKDRRPWYAEESWDDRWSYTTKIAHLWRIQVEAAPPTFFYEKVMAQPDMWVEVLMAMSPVLAKSSATPEAVRTTRGVWLSRRRSDVTLSDIQEPERARFKEAMERLGYL